MVIPRVNIPSWEELPFKKGEPVGCAWGLWDDEDEKGTLSLITAETRIAAARLRSVAEHKILKKGYPAFDDSLVMNTQSSTHWDGLRHFAHQKGRDPMEPRFYNNVTADDIVGEYANDKLGMQNLAKQGIVGRGVLLDYRRWADQHSKADKVGIGKTIRVTVEELELVAVSQGVKFQLGDILLIRFGWTQGYLQTGTTQRQAWTQQAKDIELIGLDNTEHSLEWLWNNHFAAVASDSPTFEAWPSVHKLHETILSLWGCPIGELFNLEQLAEDCAEDGVYEFLFTSAPIYTVGGVAGPANALAIK